MSHMKANRLSKPFPAQTMFERIFFKILQLMFGELW
ncbi:hypothetical protein IWT30_01322 [Secundilactobacillus mixtipabuli]|uniref:Uncharacterized protein n=1 Tax=Secundilactobacillus mixtipabuli TaxID=1435342 RepID=A0A1Z5IC56_9LACO|nr:hypothetical protein IWT30_01322 [Secundilactobacillus mixtipabuli]